MPPGWIVGVVVVSTVLFASRETSAGTIDDSTVRVFSVGTVGTETLDLRGHRVQIASPVSGHGTGFVVGDGLVMTAQHVIDGARHVVLRFPGKAGFFAARVVFADKDKDTAVLAFDGGGAPIAPLALSSAPPQVRRPVFAIGYPIDPTRTMPQSARGIVAGFLEDGTVQLDMALNPGNSGGPIVDEQDAVVGMAIARGDVEKGVQGIGYAVPVDRLVAALAEGRLRLAEAAKAAPVTSRESATVVDELIQHGALYELKKTTEKNAGAYDADVEKALAELTSRIRDPDLLVYVAATLWNAAIVVELSEPKDRPAALTPDGARALTARLRTSAVTACDQAVKLDATVKARSSFVQVALASRQAPGAAASTAGTSSAVPIYQPVKLESSVRLGPLVRFNPDGGSTGLGFGAGVGLAVRPPDQPVGFLMGLAVGRVSLSKMSSDFTHTLWSVELGLQARYDQVELSATLAPIYYSSSVKDAGESASADAWTMSLRSAVGYTFGNFQVGAGLRFLSGPTVWLEPVFASAVF